VSNEGEIRARRPVLVGVLLYVAAMLPLLPARAAEVAPTVETPVERGRYLVQAANCISCHTARGGKAFAGGRAFATTYGFAGRLYSTNITPDRDTGLGFWTEQDFINAMRLGLGRGGEHLFPAFPYTAFARLTTADIKAIYAYLRTVPAVRARPPANSFWFQQRWAMVLWNGLYFTPAEFVPDARQSAAWNRGCYLVEALGHCSACHTPRNLLLAEDKDARMTGGALIDDVEAGKARRWFAPNLTAAKSGLAQWSADDLQKYLKLGHNRWAGTLGPMNEVIANSLQQLTDADVAAMAVYVKSLAASGESAQLTLSAAERAAGQALYDKHCAECHRASGRGGFRKAPPVAGSPVVQAQDAASLVNVILYGAYPAAEIPASFNTWEDMPAFRNKLTDAEVSQLANFLRATWGNRGGRVSAGFVADQR
jgi:mono/diheme cytochrome c family protein